MGGKLRFLCCAVLAVVLLALMLGRGEQVSRGASPSPATKRIARFEHANARMLREARAASRRRKRRLRLKRHVRLVRRSHAVFRRLSADDAYGVAVDHFPAAFRAHALAPPIDAAEGDHVRKYVSMSSAVVTRPETTTRNMTAGPSSAASGAGTRAERRRSRWQPEHDADPNLSRGVVASTLPLRATDADGTQAPLSTTLDEHGVMVAPHNALVRQQIALDAAEGVSLPDVGITLRMADAPRRDGEVHGDRVFWPNVAQDTDYLVASTPTGFETFNLLRSAASPDTIPYDFGLPVGAAIVLDPLTGRADVKSSGGEVLARISRPFATDSDGRVVPSHWVQQDGELSIAVSHRDADVRYPVLVDPEITVDQLNWKDNAGIDFGGWEFVQSGSGFQSWQEGGPWGRGLQQAIPGGYTPQQYQWSMWRFHAPGDTFISRFEASRLYFAHFGGRACLSLGFWNGYGWDAGEMSVAGYNDSSPWTRCPDGANIDNSYQVHRITNWNTVTHGNYAAVQLWATGAINSQWPDETDLGGAWVVVQDDGAPTSPAFSGIPGGWSNAGQMTVGASAHDGGLGMGDVLLSYIGETASDWQGLSENYNGCWPDPQHNNLCPGDLGTSAATTFPEGFNVVAVDAWDALDNYMGDIAGTAAAVRIDRRAPTMTLSGPAYEMAGQDVGESSYPLAVDAADANPNPDVTVSGIASIEMLVDGQVKDSWSQGCDVSCLEWGAGNHAATLTFRPDDYADGSHQVAVRVRDQAGNIAMSPAWTLNVVSGSVTNPGIGFRAGKRLTLEAHARRPGVTSVQWQYRTAAIGGAPAGAWTSIPLAALSDKQAQPLGSATVALSGADSPPVSWDLTGPGGPSESTIDVRGVFSGGAGGATTATRVQVDLKGLDARTATADIGPGSVNLLSGNFTLGDTDVSIDAGLATLAVARTYNSRDSATTGPVGPGWVLSTPGLLDGSADYVGLTEGAASVTLVRADGSSISFSMTASGYRPERGYESLSLTKDYFAASGGTDRRYVVKDATNGTTVEFHHTSLNASSFYPAVLKSTASAGTSTAVFEATSGGKPRVKEIFAPSSSGQDCAAAFVKGCRSLRFIYASSTTATGNLPSQWGDVTDRLSRVEFRAWDTASGAITFRTVASYTYDGEGRLRAQWDPRIAPPLKTTYTYDASGLLSQMDPPGELGWTFSYLPQGSDFSPGRLASVSRSALDNGVAQWTVAYGVALSGGAAPLSMTSSDVAAWGQADVPFDATAIFPPDAVPTLPTSDYSRAEVHFVNRDGYEVNTLEPGGGLETSERDRYGNVVRELGAQNRRTALDAGSSSVTRSRELDTQRTYAAEGQELSDEVGPLHEVRLNSGELVDARKHTHYVYDEGSGTGTHHLPTTTTVGAQISGRSDADVRTTKTEWNWTLLQSTAVVRDPGSSGHYNNRTETVYDTTTGHVLKQRLPGSAGVDDAGTTLTIDYTAGANSVDAACGNRPEWQGWLCRTKKAANVPNSTLPDPIVSTVAYDDFGMPVTVTDASGSTTRTTTMGYDAAGRVTSVAIDSDGGGAQVPTVHTDYDPDTGRIASKSATGGDADTSLSYHYDALGRLTRYTDATGIAATTTFDVLDRPLRTTDGSGAHQDLSYDPVTGWLTHVDDSDAGVFTASYDLEGRPLTEGYAGTVTATYDYDASGSAVDLDYEKDDCTQDCTWFHETAVDSIHGQRRTENDTLAQRTYYYDMLGRLAGVDDAPAGQSCVHRNYSYDRNSNRMSLSLLNTLACPREKTSTQQSHHYDVASRLTDVGVAYDAFGRITSLPAVDSGGGRLKTSYYANDLVRQQSQDGMATTYELDPGLRPYLARSSSGGSRDETNHFVDDTDEPSWTSTTAGSTSRNVEGPSGNLDAIVDDDAGTTLQLTDLHGDVVATGATATTKVQPIQTLTATRSGQTWSASSTRPLPAGHYIVSARQSDRSGNVATSDPVHVTVSEGDASGAYAQAVLGDRPASYWRLGETSGAIAADERNALPGTYSGGVTLGGAGALAGDDDTSASFDAVDGGVAVQSPWQGDELSVESWVKTAQHDDAAFMSQGDADSGSAWSVAVTADAGHVGEAKARVRLGDTSFVVYSVHRVDDDHWHHVALSFDEDRTLTLVVDGVESTAPSDGDGDGPVLAFGFEDALGSSTVADRSGGHHDGTLTGYGAGQPSGSFGRARKFTYVTTASIPNSADLRVSSTFTVEGWVKASPTVSGSYYTDVLTEYGATGTVFSLQVTGYYGSVLPGVGSNKPSILSNDLRPGVWGHVAMTFAGGTRKIYINGALVRTDTGIVAPDPSTTSALRIGGGDGTVDEVRLYPRELSQAEIQADMNTPVEPALSRHPTLALGFNSSMGDLYSDSSDRAHTVPSSPSLATAMGKWDTAMVASTSSNLTITGDGDFKAARPLTVEAWLNPSNTQPLLGGSNLKIYGAGPSGQGPGVCSGSTCIWKPGPAPLNTWSHVAATFDGSLLGLVVDGTLVGSAPLTAPALLSDDKFYVGKLASGTYPYWTYGTGLVDEVRVYRRALPASEIQRDSAASVTSYVGGLADPVLHIGRQQTGPAFDGSVDEPAMWLSAVPAATFAKHYRVGRVTAAAPAPTLEQPTDTLADPTPSFAGTATDKEAAAAAMRVDVFDGSDTTQAPVQSLEALRDGDDWTAEGARGLAPGDYTAKVTQTDAAGRYGTAKRSFTVSDPPDPETSYRASVLADGPIAYWRLAEASGSDAADESGGGHAAAYENGVALGQPSALASDSGDHAVVLDGVDDRLDAGDAAGAFDFGASDFSVEAWVKTTQAGDEVIAGKGGDWALDVTGDGGHEGRARLTLSDGASSTVAYSSVAVDDGVWHHVVAAVHRGAGVTVFVDGSAGTAVTDATSGVLASGASLLIGAGPGGPAFGGSVDDVAVYSSALDAGRVVVHWRLGALLDHDAPTVTIDAPADGAAVADATPTFSGTAGDASTDASTVVVQITPDASAGPLETFEADEFGVPADPGYPHRYGWLGGKQRSTELPSGVVQMGVRSYVPALGRFLQPDPVLGGSANPYDYAFQDPLNVFDLDGERARGKITDWCLVILGCVYIGTKGPDHIEEPAPPPVSGQPVDGPRRKPRPGHRPGRKPGKGKPGKGKPGGQGGKKKRDPCRRSPTCA